MSVAEAALKIEELFKSFDINEKIDAIEKEDKPTIVPVEFIISIDATIELDPKSSFAKSSSPPKSLSKGGHEKFDLTQGDELKYILTAGEVKGDFKIKFDIDDGAPKLKLSDELEDGDKTGVGFRTTKIKKETEIKLETEIETEVKWTKGKKVEKKLKKESESEGEAGGYEFEYKVSRKIKQEKDEYEEKSEQVTELEQKTVTVTWEIY
ncbi:hypothetical protein TWF694_006408 [Orbilia ellipsospora]|uniref:Uncharacterized protein n=1 Tax=Orbilia ellipsospora TaxID=2528407 RepID=A0AAV9XJY6_9PEZI